MEDAVVNLDTFWIRVPQRDSVVDLFLEVSSCD